MNANIVTAICCFSVGKVGFGDACLVARFCDQYWSTFRPVLVHIPTSTGTYLLLVLVRVLTSTASLGDQYWFVLYFSKPLHDYHLKKKKSPDRSLDL